MRSLLQNASRSLLVHAAPRTVQQANRSTIGDLVKTSKPAICQKGQYWTGSFGPHHLQLNRNNTLERTIWRQISSFSPSKEKEQSGQASTPFPLSKQASSPRHGETPPHVEPDAPARAKVETTKTEDTIARVAAEDLPSHREKQRWDFSKRITEMMDEILPKLAVVTQKVNTFTGTDYSSIEALRREIKDQESLVKTRRQAIDEAKHALDAAHAQKAAAQKELVALLERKHSWSDVDLERYMSLVRSDHINDQAVKEAKEAVISAENALEEARTVLEKRERAQYHEEQIWSDTIRRNSTWVTFGLMGVNIFLLLATMLVLEPWRRRRMVREIKNALESQKTAVGAMPALEPLPSTPLHSIPYMPPQPMPTMASHPIASLEAAIDENVEPVDQTLEELASSPPVAVRPVVLPIPAIELHSSNPEVDAQLPETQKDEPDFIAGTPSEQDVTANIAPEPVAPEKRASLVDSEQTEEAVSAFIFGINVSQFAKLQKKLKTQANDLMSEQYISIRKKDLTNRVLEGAAIGAVITGVLLQILWS